MKIPITSVSRKEQRLDSVPAAVTVITHDDIRRFGITTLPDLFRLVPGMQVAQINSNNWAISVRGFNDLWSNKLLVLIDGRSIYTRSFSGVYWNAADLMLQDIDRIEIVRGPGGSAWGANAVNGVINIVTKAAGATKGTVAQLGRGTYGGTQAAVRYGGSFGNTDYRVFSQWSDHESSLIDRHTPAKDGWTRFTNGFRIDSTSGANAVMTEGSFIAGRTRALWTSFDGPTARLSVPASSRDGLESGSLLARWTHDRDNGESLQIQSFVNAHRVDFGSDTAERETTYDLDLQFHTKVTARHDIVLGGGYRQTNTTTDGSFFYSVSPRTSNNAVLNAFVHDDIALTDRLRLQIGARADHDSTAGWSVAPTARIIADVTPQQHLWAAASRALRTPSASELGMRFNYAAFMGDEGVPIVLGVRGNPHYKTEEFLDVEGGYRINIGTQASADVTLFRGRYNRLTTYEPAAVFETTPEPHLLIYSQLENLLKADTVGVEISGHWTPVKAWRLDASYSGLQLVTHADAASHDPLAALYDGNAPTHQWQIHSSASFGSRLELAAGLFHVGRVRRLNVPAYTRADARLEFQLFKPLSVVASGQNLLAPMHAEYAGTETGATPTFIPRSTGITLLWRF